MRQGNERSKEIRSDHPTSEQYKASPTDLIAAYPEHPSSASIEPALPRPIHVMMRDASLSEWLDEEEGF